MKGHLLFVLTAASTLVMSAPALADVQLPNVFGDNMVLQRDKELRIWGTADPGEKVSVTVANESAAAAAGRDGKWMVKLRALPAGGPHQVTVQGNNKVTLKDVLIGDVWICSGQSNMAWSVLRANNPQEEIAAAKHPGIRLLLMPRTPAGTPRDDVDAKWTKCQPEVIGEFSAVAYYFGRYLHQQLDVPIGLVATAWGGTRIEPWTPIAGFRSVPQLAALAGDIEKKHADHLKAVATAKASKQAQPPHPLESRSAPTGLYNGMIHPFVPLAIRGAIWYQGEANRRDGVLYEQKMHALIKGWRQVFDQDEFPFLFVQLAPYQYGMDNPALLPQIWEAQQKTLALPNTGMAVTNDIGNIKNIHPKNKQDVGKRLALWALAKTYGQTDVVYSGPLYNSMSVEGNKMRISFVHVGSGLTSRDGKPLTWFTIAGKDGKFVEARAEIDADTVTVFNEAVSNPTAVRFGWHKLAEPNLMNKEGLPASSFRTGP